MSIIDLLAKKDLKRIKRKSFKKGDILFYENDKCHHIGYIVLGKIQIISYLYNGNEIIYNSLKENEIFGNNLIFSSKPYFKGNIICLTDGEVILIEKKDLIYLFEHNNAFLIKYLEIQSNFGKKLNNHIKLLSFHKAEDRLLFFLHQNNGYYEYDSISNLAKELNLKRETLSRTITKLEKQKIIFKENKVIKVI